MRDRIAAARKYNEMRLAFEHQKESLLRLLENPASTPEQLAEAAEIYRRTKAMMDSAYQLLNRNGLRVSK
jgi:uncharacterized protein (DUF1778 family)